MPAPVPFTAVSTGIGAALFYVRRRGKEGAMSLTMIIGSAGSGKTREIFSRMIAASLKDPGRRFFVIVPEQVTMQAQRELLMLHPGRCILNLEVTSLNRLAYRVFEETGFSENELLEEIGKSFILEKAAIEKSREMRFFGPGLTKPETVAELKAVISELMLYDVTPADLLSLVRDEEGNRAPIPGQLRQKISDVATLYQAFRDKLEGAYMTSEEIPDRFCALAGRSSLIRGSVMAFDGFTGFTPVQLRLLAAFLPLVPEMMVTVTADPDTDLLRPGRKTDLFAMSHDTVRALRKIAGETGTVISEPVVVGRTGEGRHAESPALAHLEKNLFRGGEAIFPGGTDDIEMVLCRDPRAEVTEAAKRILRAAREQGFRWRDIAVAAGSLDVYGRYVREIFGEYGIPFFLDEKRSLLGNPLVEYLRAALEVVSGNFTYEAVFRMLKCGIAGFSREEVDRLENYALGRGLRGKKQWNTDFIYAYRDEDPAEVPAMNELRKRFASLIMPLAEAFSKRRGTVLMKAEALYRFAAESGAEERIAAMAAKFEQEGRPELVREYTQVWPYICGLLDRLVDVLGDERISSADFVRLLDAGFQEARVGIIPPGTDRVTVCDVERSRVPGIRMLIFLGMNEGLVPKPLSPPGIFTDADRERLEDAEIVLRPSAVSAVSAGRFYLYMMLSKPSEKLVISCCACSADGREAKPSVILDEILRIFPGLSLLPAADDPVSSVEREEDGMKYIAAGLRKAGEGRPDGAFLELVSRFSGDPGYSDRVRRLILAAGSVRREERISRDAARRLYGSEIRTSATRLETFYGCAFRHFLNYGLALSDRPSYEFSALDYGNILHRAMEFYAGALMGREEEYPDEESRVRLADEAFGRALDELGAGSVLYSDSRNRYGIGRMRRALETSVRVMAEQDGAGSFRIWQVERDFREMEEIGASSLSLPGGARMILRGRIDRIDVAGDSGVNYIRVMDYKTGVREFEPDRIFYGLQLQLPLYMRAAVLLAEKEGLSPVPAGLYYFRLWDPVLAYEEGESREEYLLRRMKEMKPSGVALDDPDAIASYDRNIRLTGESPVIGVKYTKEGKISSRKSRHLPVVDLDGMRTIGSYALRKAGEAGAAMLEGEAAVNPYRMGTETACAYCPYRSVCGYDEKIPGFRMRNLSTFDGGDAVCRMREVLDELDG